MLAAVTIKPKKKKKIKHVKTFLFKIPNGCFWLTGGFPSSNN